MVRRMNLRATCALAVGLLAVPLLAASVLCSANASCEVSETVSSKSCHEPSPSFSQGCCCGDSATIDVATLGKASAPLMTASVTRSPVPGPTPDTITESLFAPSRIPRAAADLQARLCVYRT